MNQNANPFDLLPTKATDGFAEILPSVICSLSDYPSANMAVSNLSRLDGGPTNRAVSALLVAAGMPPLVLTPIGSPDPTTKKQPFRWSTPKHGLRLNETPRRTIDPPTAAHRAARCTEAAENLFALVDPTDRSTRSIAQDAKSEAVAALLLAAFAGPDMFARTASHVEPIIRTIDDSDSFAVTSGLRQAVEHIEDADTL